MKKTVIFGSGQIGSMLRRLAGTDYRVTCFADNHPKRQGQLLHGLPILSPEDAVKTNPDCFFIGVRDTERTLQMEQQLHGEFRCFDVCSLEQINLICRSAIPHAAGNCEEIQTGDRKSTRLNSSHS